MLRNLISVLKEQGIKKEDGMTCVALAETKEELADLGYESICEINANDVNRKYLGTKLVDGVICYASSDDKELLTCAGYEADDDIPFILHHGVHLWKKAHGYKKLVKPFGY